ncbi:M20/M25/M40 family metallo-hydrolase [Litchfieldia alkalitelluris]|uniref:M20/M25/M40 family metallo-hydrolase n=1 Tax=Litchfieldia alkalitelluris TaxID=304268 RepID=UPI0009964094|nr:M20/M25/M40 family metallo-hydrolase [Litchfieldia alkalitelluris]
METSINEFYSKTKEILANSIMDLKQFCALPSISAQKKMIPETVSIVEKMVNDLGGNITILDEFGGNPIVFAFFEAGPNGNKEKTILFYNHYDVQPPEPLDEWDTPPFELTEIDGKLFARGAADNKGDLIARFSAIKVLIEMFGELPCNLKFIIEGEEEIGSPTLPLYIEKYKELLKADACIWEHADRDAEDRVNLLAGVKGMAYFELTCESADMDLHSKHGAVVENAAWRLTHALASMKNDKNEILVEGFYNQVLPPTELEVEYTEKIPFDEQSMKELFGLKHPLSTTAKGRDPREATVFDPTMTICGFESGYYGEGSKTIIPKRALAKLDCRLVPEQDPYFIQECIENHLKLHGYTDIKVKMLNGVKAYRSNLADPFVSLMVRTAEDVYGTEVVLSPNNAGTGPMSDFGNLLNIPIVSTGVGWASSRLHAPNESIRSKDFEEGIVHIAHLISEFAKS